MSRFLSEHVYRNIDNVYVELVEDLFYESDILREQGYDPLIIAPAGLVHDLESVPRYIRTKYGWLTKLVNLLCSPVLAGIFWLLSNTSKRGGTIHDALYRSDCRPEISKELCDLVYLEIMELRGNKKMSRWAKYKAVKWFGKDSFHRFSVSATYEEITGKKEIKA